MPVNLLLGLDVKRALNSGVFVGPRMQAVSQGLTVTGGYAHQFFLEVDSVVEVRKAVGEMMKMGVDWVKCMASIEWSKAAGEPISAVNMSPELMHEAFDITHHHGKRCMVHAVCKDSIVNSLDAGVDSIEHGVMLDEMTAERMAREDVFLVPTLSGWRERCNDWGRDAGHVRHAELMRPIMTGRFGLPVPSASRWPTVRTISAIWPMRSAVCTTPGLSLSECLVVATRNGADCSGYRIRWGRLKGQASRHGGARKTR